MDASRIFIVGANGQLGQALKVKYPYADSADIDRLDITDLDSVLNYDWSRIDIVINAAAYTNVDGAETDEGRIAAWKVNAMAVSHLVRAALEHNMTLVHISTDYVFDGTKTPHKEDEPFSPLNVYGQTKAAADIVVSLLPMHYIIRTSWVIGEGKNFVRSMLKIARSGKNPSVVSDQIGRLTFVTELVKAIDYLLTSKGKAGTYNVSNSGDISSWAEIARSVIKDAGFNLLVKDISTKDYYGSEQNYAARPLNSVLDLTKIESTGLVLRDWRNDLANYIKKELD